MGEQFQADLSCADAGCQWKIVTHHLPCVLDYGVNLRLWATGYYQGQWSGDEGTFTSEDGRGTKFLTGFGLMDGPGLHDPDLR